MSELFISIPTWKDGEWYETDFETKEEFRDYVLMLFKEPGKYRFNEDIYIGNEEARKFEKDSVYCTAPFRSKDFIYYWDEQKRRCQNGVLIHSGSVSWYITRDYYMWLNFLPIFNKEIQKFGFAKIRDAQYHMALYELLAELHYKHAAVLKKRQIASSYFHIAKLLNQLWFEPGVTLKIGASLKDYINDKGSWKFLDEYASFLNEHTAWYRPMNPNKVLLWQQKIEARKGNRVTEIGLKGTIQGMSFEKSATSGVGGPTKYFFYEEAGIAPKLDQTYEYMRPALQSGMITTGMFIAAGSVGDLDACEPLKRLIMNAEENDIYTVETNLMDEDGTIAKAGLFIPEQWSMPPYIDKYGNSLVEEALQAIKDERVKMKKELPPEQYQLRISQKPTNIKEAFAYRKESVFPTHLVSAQLKRCEDKEYPYELIDLFRGDDGALVIKETNKQPIKEFPVSKTLENKEGSIVVWERPKRDPTFGMYYASVDPVGEGKAEWVENLVYTPFGKKRIGDIKLGDSVIGSNGKPIKVLGVYPQGKKELYRITFDDNSSILVCKEHLWAVQSNGGEKKDYHVLSVDDFLNEEKILEFNGIGRNKDKIYKTKTYYKNNKGYLKWRIPITKPIEFKNQNVLLDPYFLGLLLGDGGLSTRSTIFTTSDKELLEYIEKILPEDIFLKRKDKYSYGISSSTNRNLISKIITDLGLRYKTSIDKFIPDIYKISSIDDRLSLLQGLMDTDGYCGNHGSEYYSISKRLSEDVVEIVRSLGGIAKIRKKNTKEGVGYVYVVRVLLPENMCPFKLTRKKDLYYSPKKFSRYIKNIQFERIDNAVCISVDSDDHLYVTENAIVTHNTTTSDSLCSIFIYKTATEVTKDDGQDIKVEIEQDGIVASWCGRFDDIKKTHERLELLIEWYNAWTIVENNVSLFIQYMMSKKKQRYLVTKDQMLFLKDLGSNRSVHQEYGWRNTGHLFRTHLISYAIEYLRDEIDQITDENGKVFKTTYGVTRIPDPMLLKEMLAYHPGLNVDRLVAFSALIAFASVQQANRGYTKRREQSNNSLENTANLYKFKVSPFRHIGGKSNHSSMSKPKRAFKNFR